MILQLVFDSTLIGGVIISIIDTLEYRREADEELEDPILRSEVLWYID